jgi:hypothetical protein
LGSAKAKAAVAAVQVDETNAKENLTAIVPLN